MYKNNKREGKQKISVEKTCTNKKLKDMYYIFGIPGISIPVYPGIPWIYIIQQYFWMMV